MLEPIRELGKLIDGNGGQQPFCFLERKNVRNSTSIRHVAITFLG
jgi:hypothetical protein